MTMTDGENATRAGAVFLESAGRPFALDGIKHEPLTYERDLTVSFFADLVRRDKDERAAQRLAQHAAEMRVIAEERSQRALREVRTGLEYRVEPNTTPGTGGYISPPLWLNQLFATANRPRRILADLIPQKFPLALGASSVNLPIIGTGTEVTPGPDNTPVADQDVTDAAGSSDVVTLRGDADVSLQMLEQSPAGAHLDFVLFTDLAEAYDAQLETQLINGLGAAADQILGVINVTGINKVTYTDSSPTGSEIYPLLGEAAGQIGDNRDLPPEIWLMRTARWTWLATSEDTATLPFGLPSPFFMGSDDKTPDPVTGLIGFPLFLDDAIPVNLGTGANQDIIIACRPSDLILLEGEPQTAVMREPLSGSLGVRLQFHCRAACITNRHAAGIATIGGTGDIPVSGF